MAPAADRTLVDMNRPAPTLSVAAAQLMPDPGTSPKCADHSVALAVDPGGNAVAAAIVLTIETPLPWPKPIFAHDFLDGIKGTPQTVVGASRILGAVPENAETVGRVHAWWRTDSGVQQAVLQVNTPTEVHELVDELSRVTPDQSRFLTDQPAPQHAVLICTQGSHDICCGTEGTRLALDAQATLGEDVAIMRVSHTGGHRFSPTAMTLPDGRMWAYLTTDDLQEILAESGDAVALSPKCRGWWGAARGPAQMAERAVFAELGWSLNHQDRTVEDHGDGTFTVHVGPDRWDVAVEIGREVPTIACRALGGMPGKTGREYAVTSVRKLPSA